MKILFFLQIMENTQISNFIKICPMGAEMFHADGHTDRRDEANNRLPKFCEGAQ
jgi:hypothetical protein